jgi:MoxR-like ATPase
MVIATQNPAEHHGTFPLPESQLDRFLMKVHIGYPDRAAEKEVLDRPNMLHPAEELEPVLTAHDVLELQQDVDKVHLDDSLLDYLLSIVERTRHSEFLALGVSTRGAAALSRAAKALAFSRERHYCIPDDIKELVSIVLPHRVTLKSGQGLRGPQLGQAEQVIRDIVESVPVPL